MLGIVGKGSSQKNLSFEIIAFKEGMRNKNPIASKLATLYPPHHANTFNHNR